MIFQTSLIVATILCIASLVIATPLLPGQGSATFYPSLSEKNYTPQELNILACHNRPDSNELAAKKTDLNFPMEAAAGAFTAMSDHAPLWVNSGGEECAKNPDNPKAEPSCHK
ncbi:hypothetical protein BKA69DRAFT_1129351 [Paraphysoderma sedebokerense]|nr:hypothetical protein BKA69DRAFT_1129351 [Paraphysoderma sedebokerense]